MNDVLCSIQFDVSISMNYEYTVGKLYSSHCFIIQRCIYVFPEVAIDMVAYTIRVYNGSMIGDAIVCPNAFIARLPHMIVN